MQLYIGNKNYSSWSLRGWLILKAFDLPFTEKQLKLFTDSFYIEIEKVSGARKVPVLVDDDNVIWDSLAICEYVNEAYLAGKGWPQEVSVRAEARAVSCEMHSGFFALREEMPMNCRARRVVELSDAAQRDLARIVQIWNGLRSKYKDSGPWLFGQFSIADVMYAPVALRFVTYGIELEGAAKEYMNTLIEHPAVKTWVAEGIQERDIVEEDEAGIER
jgi:glutathione S-transferase